MARQAQWTTCPEEVSEGKVRQINPLLVLINTIWDAKAKRLYLKVYSHFSEERRRLAGFLQAEQSQ